jgi:hypothetical protein
MTHGAHEPHFLCSAKVRDQTSHGAEDSERVINGTLTKTRAQAPYAIEHANGAWCELTGFASHLIKGSHGLSILKGPQTDEDLVSSAWGIREKSITVIHYTAGGSVVDHTIHVTPILAEDSDTITHYLVRSSFAKHIGRGNFFAKAKKIVASQHFHVPLLDQHATSEDEENGPIDPAERPKNIHQLRKENALKNLGEYADRLSESVRSQVQLTALKDWPPEDPNKAKSGSRGQYTSDTADRINSFKTRFNAAKTAAKREKDKEKRRKEKFAVAAAGDGARPLTGYDTEQSGPATPAGVALSTARSSTSAGMASASAASESRPATRATRVPGQDQILMEGEGLIPEGRPT